MTPDQGTGAFDGRRGAEPGGNGRLGRSCPDADLLAGLVDGRLLPAEREHVERHIDDCDACRAVVAALARDANRAPMRSIQARRQTTMLLAAAAAALLIGFGVWVVWGTTGAEPTEREQLAAAFRRLGDADPELFAGIHPLSDEDLDEPSLIVTRGGFALLSPVGTVLDERPEVRWEDVPGIARWEVQMSTDELQALWRRASDTNVVDYPSDQLPLVMDHSYIVRVEGRGPGGPLDVEQPFVVAGPAVRDAFARRVAALERTVDDDIRALALAHAALAQDLLADAERAARRHCAAHPHSRIGHQTLRQVLRRIGAREAERLRIPVAEDR